MTSVYPKEENPNGPPTYEQSMYYPQAPPIPSFGMHSVSSTILQPQGPPVGMYPTSTMVPSSHLPPIGMYSTSATVPPSYALPTGMYPTYATDIPPQGPPVGTHMLITTQALCYGDMPIQCSCPHCYQSIITRVEKTTGLVAWLICGGILLLGGWLGCCLIPFCVDGLKDTEHYCPNCAVLLGTRRRM